MSLASLDGEHLASFKQAMTNILSTPLAEFTYAQIIDGMPTSDTYKRDHWHYEGAPAVDHHELCPGIMEKTRAFRSEFDVLSLKFDPKTIQAYKNTAPGSVAYKLRLLELVAIACHDIAVFLYRLDDGVHKHAEWETWHAEKLDSLARQESTETRAHRFWHGPPTPFFRTSYMFWKSYPNGLADVAGYWAEHHIFGGTVLFDRGESEEECNGIYIHRPESTFTLAPPTEKQFNDLVDFLLSSNPETDGTPCPLPIRITDDNKWRWHPYDGMVDYHIYKFRYEVPEEPRPRDHCDISITDWPEVAEDQAIEDEGIKRLEGEGYDEGVVAAAWERMRRTVTPTSKCYPKRSWDEAEMSRIQPDPKKQGRPPYFFDP